MSRKKDLVMSFDPRTIEHLGIKMYSHLPNAIAELIANGYDACSSKVTVSLTDGDERQIIVSDDGIGMDFDEVNEKFLRIGRNRREDDDHVLPCDRIPTGKKGLGKLAFFGIGDIIIIETKKDGELVNFEMKWVDLLETPPGEDYKPEFFREKCINSEHGTKITLKKLKRKTNFDFEGLAKSLAKLFNFPDEKFEVVLDLDGNESRKIDNKLKYEGLVPQFEWVFNNFALTLDSEYKYKSNIRGTIITTEKPLKPGLRGIVLFANGRMVNSPEFFGSSESSHFFSYITGWLDVDFVDNFPIDVISTSRQSLDWENSDIIELKEFLQLIVTNIHMDWREKRKQNRRDKLNEKLKERTKINLDDWFSKLPDDIETGIESILNTVIEDSELSQMKADEITEALHEIAPEYPYYHWRHLHSDIHQVAENDYKNEDYLRAAIEAIKVFEKKIQNLTSLPDTGRGLMQRAFGSKSSILLLTDNVSKSENDIEDGHGFLSEGVVVGFRNPVQHEFKTDLYPELFNDKDCLDILSLASYLIRKGEQTKRR